MHSHTFQQLRTTATTAAANMHLHMRSQPHLLTGPHPHTHRKSKRQMRPKGKPRPVRYNCTANCTPQILGIWGYRRDKRRDKQKQQQQKMNPELTRLHSRAAALCSSRWRKQCVHLLLLKMFGENLRHSMLRLPMFTGIISLTICRKRVNHKRTPKAHIRHRQAGNREKGHTNHKKTPSLTHTFTFENKQKIAQNSRRKFSLFFYFNSRARYLIPLHYEVRKIFDFQSLFCDV